MTQRTASEDKTAGRDAALALSIDPGALHGIALKGYNLPGETAALTVAALAAAAPRGLVLFVYPKDATAGCTQEADDFQALLTDFTAAGVGVAGLSKDTVASHRRFASARDYTFLLLADPERRLLGALGAVVAGTMYGKPVQRTERATFYFAPDGRLERQWRGVRVPGHAAAVLTAVSPLLSPT